MYYSSYHSFTVNPSSLCYRLLRSPKERKGKRISHDGDERSREKQREDRGRDRGDKRDREDHKHKSRSHKKTKKHKRSRSKSVSREASVYTHRMYNNYVECIMYRGVLT